MNTNAWEKESLLQSLRIDAATLAETLKGRSPEDVKEWICCSLVPREEEAIKRFAYRVQHGTPKAWARPAVWLMRKGLFLWAMLQLNKDLAKDIMAVMVALSSTAALMAAIALLGGQIC